MSDWTLQLDELLRDAGTLPPTQVVERLAALAFEVPEAEATAWLDARAAAGLEASPLADPYLHHLQERETREARRLLAAAGPHGRRFLDVAGESGRVGYERVAAMFEHVDFAHCRRLVMIGCGPLPVTALHVAERAGVPDCVLLDVSAAAVADCAALVRAYGWRALAPQVGDGAFFDYAGAHVVYVANVVRPKAATVARIAATAGPEVQLVLREPWSLGRLWSEAGEPAALGAGFTVVARGPVSRHLSRDVILRRAG
jgi:hypothetical protein